MLEQDTPKPYPDGVGAIFEIARRLRAPDGCPWDREQTHESLRPYLLEETYELLETIDRREDDGKLLEELGDVLLQVAMHAAIAGEQGRFDAARVSEAAAAKMVARHPHVFGDTEVSTAEEVLRNWEQQKAAEAARAGNGDQTVLDRVPPTLPALAWTLNMQKRAARVGFDLDSAGDARGRVAERAGEASSFEEVGDLLLDVVGLARTLRINPEDALRAAGQRYRDRFARMDREVTARGGTYRDLDRAEQLELWERAG
ncbi:MAG: nucleoside triphosphate pyrophosphohydrolase [Candidatus Dormibacteraeota bacterium]|nr:nucleoside triphosphate pyrophosphohydrolase [Candidatus Dormibacteraeota bacterium]MBO0705119.1 nucleoside triphosphate pyrophosphohydrolase [Candidatus Dormibacteraeota bacterium]MBO0761633.1 nucleoside triphosphate pyrophosphohydrolase [Candidatus Dormibacteraeota bacterium]